MKASKRISPDFLCCFSRQARCSLENKMRLPWPHPKGLIFVSIPQDPTPAENNNDANSTEEAQLAPPGQEQPKTEEGADDATSPSPEAQLPPEAQGEINGGPLGCCLGVMVGLLLSLSVAVISRFYADPLAQVLGEALSIVIRI